MTESEIRSLMDNGAYNTTKKATESQESFEERKKKRTTYIDGSIKRLAKYSEYYEYNYKRMVKAKEEKDPEYEYFLIIESLINEECKKLSKLLRIGLCPEG